MFTLCEATHYVRIQLLWDMQVAKTPKLHREISWRKTETEGKPAPNFSACAAQLKPQICEWRCHLGWTFQHQKMWLKENLARTKAPDIWHQSSCLIYLQSFKPPQLRPSHDGAEMSHPQYSLSLFLAHKVLTITTWFLLYLPLRFGMVCYTAIGIWNICLDHFLQF